MTTVAQIRWGKYDKYEGPYFPGTIPFPTASPEDPEVNKIMTVVTATEGGKLDAINMYDRCIMTASYIQWCDAAQMSVCDMLGVISKAGVSIEPVESAAHGAHGKAKLAWVSPAKFRWVMPNGELVDTGYEQRQIYFNGASGLQGQWPESNKAYARNMAAAMATVLSEPEALQPQIDFTAARIHWFYGTSTKSTLFAPYVDMSNPLIALARAAYVSFAANLPSVADKMYARTGTADFGSRDWLIRLLRNLTFGPGISIYPGRYGKIRPELERLYGVDLPDFADDLRIEKETSGLNADSPQLARLRVLGVGPYLSRALDVQRILLHLGYDLGPAKADGVAGKKTLEAIRRFQTANGLVSDGIVGRATRAVMVREATRI